MNSALLELNLRKTPVGGLIRRAPQARQLVAGVDGGGTGTRAVILNHEQCVIGEGHAGPSNPLRVGIATAATWPSGAPDDGQEATWAGAGAGWEPARRS